MNSYKILFRILICVAALCGIYIGFIFLMGAFVIDIDYTEEQRNAAQNWVVIGQLFGLILIIASSLAIVISGAIVKFLLKLSNKNSITKLDI